MPDNEIMLLKRENEKQALKLKEEDWWMIKKIMKSMSVFKVNSYDRHVIQRDLIGMAQELRLRDSSLQEAIGDDVIGFANEIINNSGGPCTREIWLKFLERLSRLFLFFFTVTAIFGYGRRGPINPIISYLYYLGFVLIGFLTEEIIGPLFVADKGIKKALPSLISISLFIILINLTNLLADKQYAYGDTIGPEVVPTIVISGLMLLLVKCLKVKNIHRLAQGKNNFIDDLK
ncbi:hypothetical protein [Alkaliphilus hydrothermalis]|uniref:DNA-binding ferritin-like protein (Dps family) n=1 Tax=Alkaliphilus hydrothermalis TaxID=1482730 RepID=A0ABS2NTW8_9FIRM|nr:hypothetical protein [Alkaliphilus hydrothermalis]MBM7616398.1 DNA-binding ferritin-like protein (Dps family) [Alkaliphilus hydrothermalis]